MKLTKRITIPAEFIKRAIPPFPPLSYAPAVRGYDGLYSRYDESTVRFHGDDCGGRNFLKKEIKRMFAGGNDLQVYKDFFAWTGKPELFKMRKNRTLEYSDLAPLAYLHIVLEGGTKNSVKHLLVDEMQDYSPIQYKVIQKLFPCRKTLLR